MKVLMLVTSYPNKNNPNRGIFVKHLTDNLNKIKGLKIDVLTIDSYNALTKDSGILPNLKNSLLAKMQFPIYLIHFYFLIIFRAKKYDIIHANWALTAFLAFLSKPFHNKKIILTERSSQLIFTKSGLLRRLLKYVYKTVNRLVVISEYSKKSLLDIYGIKNVSVIRNGVDFKKSKFDKNIIRKSLNINNKSKVVLFVGRLTNVKSVDSLIEGFAMSKIKGKKLIIVGDGEEQSNLKNLAFKLGVDKDIIFTGKINFNDIGRFFLMADVFVLPSIMETGGNVLLEALIFNIPIISTSVGWASDLIVNGHNGYIVRKKNPRDIKTKLELLLNNNAKLIKIKRNIKITAKNKLITWEKSANLYEKEYKLLIT